MASRIASRYLTSILRTPKTISPSGLRPYPSLPRTLQPKPIGRRWAHTIPKPPPPPPPSNQDTSATDSPPDATKPNQKKLQPHYQMIFTCVPCGHRSEHVVSKQGYHHGSVLISCPTCRARHVISDNLNIFGDRKITVEDLLREKGELVKRGTLGEDGDIEFWQDTTTSDHATKQQQQQEGDAASLREAEAVTEKDEARRLRETRDPSSQATYPTPSTSGLSGGDVGTRPSVHGVAPQQGPTPSTRRTYHAAFFHLPETLAGKPGVAQVAKKSAILSPEYRGGYSPSPPAPPRPTPSPSAVSLAGKPKRGQVVKKSAISGPEYLGGYSRAPRVPRPPIPYPNAMYLAGKPEKGQVVKKSAISRPEYRGGYSRSPPAPQRPIPYPTPISPLETKDSGVDQLRAALQQDSKHSPDKHANVWGPASELPIASSDTDAAIESSDTDAAIEYQPPVAELQLAQQISKMTKPQKEKLVEQVGTKAQKLAKSISDIQALLNKNKSVVEPDERKDIVNYIKGLRKEKLALRRQRRMAQGTYKGENVLLKKRRNSRQRFTKIPIIPYVKEGDQSSLHDEVDDIIYSQKAPESSLHDAEHDMLDSEQAPKFHWQRGVGMTYTLEGRLWRNIIPGAKSKDKRVVPVKERRGKLEGRQQRAIKEVVKRRIQDKDNVSPDITAHPPVRFLEWGGVAPARVKNHAAARKERPADGSRAR
ncbi:hypothetical protein F4808DRAFT_173392 [Astrocystis sublimbata]|nr:hypothetical protein F4808DRAFT_173392 [Astrocystis sublimbata]